MREASPTRCMSQVGGNRGRTLAYRLRYDLCKV